MKQFIGKLAENLEKEGLVKGATKAASVAKVVRQTILEMVRSGEQVRWSKFAIFSKKHVPARKYNNPTTGELLTSKPKDKIDVSISSAAQADLLLSEKDWNAK